ncbi:hypothetical protein LXA43DRAFT_1080850 [Ganoderma leucocontextum]|nr:hypothetical protein LXA43DRAFT_1080850 [Ganoderma leucocontextum]
MTHTQKSSIDSEMHELNAEADFLEQKTTIPSGGANGEATKVQSQNVDSDAQAMVIESLRNQVQDLFSQVSQLNNKLVRSYDRVSDLEDELHVTSSNLRQTTLKVGQLELERTQHLSALSTGLLVEKSHVTSELTRLMEKATEEAARRGQAESARAEIEKDLDDLSAGLFDQANRMVASARMAEARSSRKVEETEAALRSAEEVVGALQAQMQTLQSGKEHADRRVEEMRMRMGKGKWVDHGPAEPRSTRQRLFASHVPFHEFLIFVSHLRAIRPASPQPPAMSTMTPLPFLARLIAEDSDTTVRLDLAPSLNWLSRRSVIGAIHGGHLTIEPIQFTTLLEELAPPNIPASSHHTHVVCALCGMSIYSSASDSSPSTPTTPNPSRSGSQSASWSTTLFKNVRSGELNLPTLTGQQHRRTSSSSTPSDPPTLVYVFRLDSSSSGLPVSLPLSNQHSGSPARQAIYPLCTTGWCLARLRTTCSMWAFVRTSIVEKIWEEPPIPPPTNSLPKPGVNGALVNGAGKPTTLQQPPQRLPKMGSTLGSLWGSMQRSLSGSTAPTKSPDSASAKEKDKPKLPPRDPLRKALPPPPPTHPAVAHSPRNSISQLPASPAVHRVPPPLKEEVASPTVAAPVPVSGPSPAPPPLPKRNRERKRPLTPDPSLDIKPAAEAAQSNAPVVEQPKVTLAEEATPIVAQKSEAATEESTKQEPALAEAEAKAKDNKPPLVIPEGPISQSTSIDSFRTPIEDLRVDTTPADAAATVPLPPSSEPSPAKTPTSEQVTSAGPPAIDVAAPTPTTATSSTLVDEKAQSPLRTSSPAPPPLPRRAAARVRPSSILVPQVEEQPKRNSLDVPTADEAATVKEEPVLLEKAAEPKEAAVPEPSSNTPAPTAPVAVVEAAAPVTAEPESLPTSDGPTAAPTPEPEAAPAAVPVDVLKERLDTVLESKTSTPAEEKVVLVNGDAESVPSEPECVPEVPPLAYAAGQVHANANGDKKDGASSVAEESDNYNGLYVSDATWEERTYKELVRLREEMYWARIGAVVR